MANALCQQETFCFKEGSTIKASFTTLWNKVLRNLRKATADFSESLMKHKGSNFFTYEIVMNFILECFLNV